MIKKLRRDTLVRGHLEGVSKTLLESHRDVVARIIGRNAGIYALYRKQRLYYVGLATGLSGRLKQHLRDAHKDKWDTFSIYFTVRDQHIKDIESLLLQIADPPGNKVGGKPNGSVNLKSYLLKEIRNKQKHELARLIGSSKKVTSGVEDDKSADGFRLRQLFPNGAHLRATNKGARFSAKIRKDGFVRYDGKIYRSLSLAGKAAIGRSVNGWWFWTAERGRGNWVRLKEIRAAGTPAL